MSNFDFGQRMMPFAKRLKVPRDYPVGRRLVRRKANWHVPISDSLAAAAERSSVSVSAHVARKLIEIFPEIIKPKGGRSSSAA